MKLENIKCEKRKSLYQIIIIILVLFQLIEIFIGINYYYRAYDKPTYNHSLVTYLMNNRSQTSDIINTDKYELFVSGEYHATQKNFDIQMDIIKNLSQNSDLKYIISEDSMANALIINSYLKTGDSSKLDILFNVLKQQKTFAGNNETYQFIKNLYEFNKTLPDDKKLTYLGLDIEHQDNLAISYLYDIASRRGISESLDEVMDTFEKSGNDYYKNMIASLEPIYKDIKNSPKSYLEKLGDEFWTFEYLLRNSINTYKCMIIKNNYTEESSKREKAMVENFYEIYNHFPKGKYYGEWGLEHTYLNSVTSKFHPKSEPCLASALNNKDDSPVRNKVCSMAIVYFDSFSMSTEPGTVRYEICNNCSNDKQELDSLKLFAQDNIQFFKLDSEGSPFAKDLYLYSNIANHGVTTDYFKNLIVVKNSPACMR